jgi:long-chain acyl-CoA synthetase
MVWSDSAGKRRELKRGELRDRIARLGSLFSLWRLDPGDRVFVCSRNDEHTITLVAACLANGLSAVIADPESAVEEVSHLIELVSPRAAIVDQDLADTWDLSSVPTAIAISSELQKGGALIRRLMGSTLPDEKSSRTYPAVLSGLEVTSGPREIDDELEAYVLFTSGSTGGSKAVSISRRSLIAHVKTLSTHLGYDHNTRLLSALPLSHTDGLVHGCLVPWLIGATCVRPVPFAVSRIGELLDAIYTHRVTDLLVVPTLLALFERYGAGHDDAFQTGDFKLVVSSAAHLAEPLWRRFQDRFGVRVINIYGLTETVVGGLFCGPDSATFKLGTIGKPVDCEARVVGDDGATLARGEQGELQLSGELVMTGYVGDPEATDRVLTDGWLATGDVVIEDEDGFFRLVGRKKNLVISGGRNVHPEEVSDVLLKFKGVAEAVAFGIEDAVFGEAVAACVVLEDQCRASGEELRSWCRDHLTSFKTPRVVARVPSLPRGPTGKVDLRLARDLLLAFRDGDERKATGNVHNRILEAAAKTFAIPVDRLGLDSTPDNTPGWDSFAHLALILALEETFDLRFTTGDILDVGSLADAEAIVNRKLVESTLE